MAGDRRRLLAGGDPAGRRAGRRTARARGRPTHRGGRRPRRVVAGGPVDLVVLAYFQVPRPSGDGCTAPPRRRSRPAARSCSWPTSDNLSTASAGRRTPRSCSARTMSSPTSRAPASSSTAPSGSNGRCPPRARARAGYEPGRPALDVLVRAHRPGDRPGNRPGPTTVASPLCRPALPHRPCGAWSSTSTTPWSTAGTPPRGWARRGAPGPVGDPRDRARGRPRCGGRHPRPHLGARPRHRPRQRAGPQRAPAPRGLRPHRRRVAGVDASWPTRSTRHARPVGPLRRHHPGAAGAAGRGIRGMLSNVGYDLGPVVERTGVAAFLDGVVMS